VVVCVGDSGQGRPMKCFMRWLRRKKPRQSEYVNRSGWIWIVLEPEPGYHVTFAESETVWQSRPLDTSGGGEAFVDLTPPPTCAILSSTMKRRPCCGGND
jgi:hypothetical protein